MDRSVVLRRHPRAYHSCDACYSGLAALLGCVVQVLLCGGGWGTYAHALTMGWMHAHHACVVVWCHQLQGELTLKDGDSYVGNFNNGKYDWKVSGASSPSTGLPFV